jgi:hypothetical protein
VAGRKGFVHLRGFAATADLIVSACHPPEPRAGSFRERRRWLGVQDGIRNWLLTAA